MTDIVTVVNMIPRSSSGETNQDSEPNLAVNPANPLRDGGDRVHAEPERRQQATRRSSSPATAGRPGAQGYHRRAAGARPDAALRDHGRQALRRRAAGAGGGNIAVDQLRHPADERLLRRSRTMTVLAQRKNDDQPFVQAATVPSGPDAGKDRIYVGSNDHAPSNVPRRSTCRSTPRSARRRRQHVRHRRPHRLPRRLPDAACRPSGRDRLRDLLLRA